MDVSSEDPCPLCLQKAGKNTYICNLSASEPHFSIDYLKKHGLFIHITVCNCQPCDKSPTQGLVNDVENSGHIKRSNEVEVRPHNGVRLQALIFEGQRSNLPAPRSKNDLESSAWSVWSYEPASPLERGAEFVEVKPGFHVKVCTGMGRTVVREE